MQVIIIGISHCQVGRSTMSHSEMDMPVLGWAHVKYTGPISTLIRTLLDHTYATETVQTYNTKEVDRVTVTAEGIGKWWIQPGDGISLPEGCKTVVC